CLQCRLLARLGGTYFDWRPSSHWASGNVFDHLTHDWATLLSRWQAVRPTNSRRRWNLDRCPLYCFARRYNWSRRGGGCGRGGNQKCAAKHIGRRYTSSCHQGVGLLSTMLSQTVVVCIV